jgi:hypothetical protein
MSEVVPLHPMYAKTTWALFLPFILLRLQCLKQETIEEFYKSENNH